jgi:hypothetical protein
MRRIVRMRMRVIREGFGWLHCTFVHCIIHAYTRAWCAFDDNINSSQIRQPG